MIKKFSIMQERKYRVRTDNKGSIMSLRTHFPTSLQAAHLGYLVLMWLPAAFKATHFYIHIQQKRKTLVLFPG
jgi:hypothetical protein